ncbi:metal-sulfur cluster assembly factor [Pseudonocardia parietis]|uniref:Metal-sulfur cluster biosynthetic enzyme n=1 Tax=Pseudonocardia parietis TaxID=570936 RepID=A0ABS4VMJ7_9PSEU|nr:metal-sulfur cluster assembly factor [Pseudonocardia parietis]MBP2365150.1 metal-sulfur cluster biosynthetic enzyme [Pseudonocardia parietis]
MTVLMADVLDALREVIDPDLGVNVVDLGFVRDIDLDSSPVVLTMTLTSPACPLTGVMEDQMTAALAGMLTGYEVRWVFRPAWSPALISAEGRNQLAAIGFRL